MKTILFADNDPDIVMNRSVTLEKEGFQVLKAFTLAEAQRFLADANVHLAILDIRMVDDSDDKDVSGLTLAKNSTYQSIPKIILTGFPSVQAVKEALGPMLDRLPPAVDLVAKDEGLDVMILAVKKALEFVRINWDLDIKWDTREHLSFPHLVSLVYPDLPNDYLIYRANELVDLIRKLFYDYQQIQVGRLLWHDRWRFCLSVLDRSPQGTTDSHLLVCGDRERLRRDREKLREFAPKTFQGTRIFGDLVETTHFGANLYDLPGTGVETVQTLRDLYRVGRERPLKLTFDHLLGDVLKAWHGHGQTVDERGDLMSIYRQWTGLTEDRADVEKRVASLMHSIQALGGAYIKPSGNQVTFTFPEGTAKKFPDPVAAAYVPLQQYEGPSSFKVSPGKVTADNVLVDAELRAWLTDFAQADQAPQWWDFVCLEAAIRFELSQASNLLDWQEFEQCLVKPARLDEALEQNDVVPELRTSVALIEQVRRQAASDAGPASLPYFAGLLAWAVEAMTHYDPGVLYTQTDRLRDAHLLLAASMIAERLDTAGDTSLPEGRLRLDEDGRVWIRERRVAILSGLSQKLLACLFAHEGQIVNNQMIIEAYGEKNIEDKIGRDQRIRQEISRLREEIEPDPNRPRYILTERGKGYRLDASGGSGE